MTVSLKHTFQVSKTDSADATIVQPSNWNQEHVLTLTTNRLLGRTTAGTGVAEEISVSAPLSLSGGALALPTLPVANGGTGATTLTGYVKGNGTSAMTASASVPVGDLSGTLPVASGGTGAATLTANNVVLGNGTSAVQFVAPGASGNLLTSNGTTWTSAIAPATGLQGVMTVLTSGTSYTIPAGITKIKVTVVGGGGGMQGTFPTGAGGGGGGTAVKYFTVTSGASITYAVGAAGATGSAGGDSTVTVGATTVTGGGGSISAATNFTFATGGSATNGDLNIQGSSGGGAINIAFGGNSLFGTGGVVNSTGNMTPGVGYGSGAAYYSTISLATAGVVIIEY